MSFMSSSEEINVLPTKSGDSLVVPSNDWMVNALEQVINLLAVCIFNVFAADERARFRV